MCILVSCIKKLRWHALNSARGKVLLMHRVSVTSELRCQFVLVKCWLDEIETVLSLRSQFNAAHYNAVAISVDYHRISYISN